MVGTLIKQPNGKYCVIDYAGDVKHYNLTEQDIINMYIEDAKACIGDAEHFSNLIKSTVSSGYYEETLNKIPNAILNKMGFDKTYDELLKFVPRKVVNKSYCDRDCTTYGKCPNCGSGVQNGMGGSDKQCRNCEQILKW